MEQENQNNANQEVDTTQLQTEEITINTTKTSSETTSQEQVTESSPNQSTENNAHFILSINSDTLKSTSLEDRVKELEAESASWKSKYEELLSDSFISNYVNREADFDTFIGQYAKTDYSSLAMKEPYRVFSEMMSKKYPFASAETIKNEWDKKTEFSEESDFSSLPLEFQGTLMEYAKELNGTKIADPVDYTSKKAEKKSLIAKENEAIDKAFREKLLGKSIATDSNGRGGHTVTDENMELTKIGRAHV